ncbi:hypothetical protein AGDE_11759 [Angomonas deanei]|uniref:Uncharacterized protein n=1 Tax=Angomonas deanei TaxID=59799 RepID=A0A7G2CQN2_9TRYP|nr:hypothetical protein AGDE_11759 [Angomonas deanei]CAD2221785.1 Protein of unknown function (DUF3522), putative [Angomonas deanei]|eukprot:EPY25448.1 hypothetical protein AGDE_11759 [Angomonas deanei]
MPKREGDPTWALVITCVLSHLPLFLAFNLLRKRKLTFEMVVCGFSIFVSFMYHLCECLEAIIYLPEIKWHRLDNIGAISSTMGTFINLACLGPETTALVESVGFMLVLILQEGYPWNELFTIGPIVVSGGIPFFMYLLGYRKVKQCLMLKPFFTGIVLTFVGSFFLFLD